MRAAAVKTDSNELVEPLRLEAFKPFRLPSLASAKRRCALSERCIDFPFAALRVFSRKARPTKRALIVAPVAGACPILMRDLVVGSLRLFDEVAITDWADPRYVPASRGKFGISENVGHVEAIVEALGRGVDVIAICQAVTPALAETARMTHGSSRH
jgi:poly(3-hydroxybutyrate) depolymerase